MSKIINTDLKPFNPNNWEVVSHKKMGKLKWDSKNVELYLSEKQKDGYIKGEDLLKELEDKPVLNSNVLGWLLENPKEIPDEWKDKWVYFWGTILHSPYGYRCVLCLSRSGDSWCWRYRWLGCGSNASEPSAVLASVPKSLKPLSSLDSLKIVIKEIEINGKTYKLS